MFEVDDEDGQPLNADLGQSAALDHAVDLLLTGELRLSSYKTVSQTLKIPEQWLRVTFGGFSKFVLAVHSVSLRRQGDRLARTLERTPFGQEALLYLIEESIALAISHRRDRVDLRHTLLTPYPSAWVRSPMVDERSRLLDQIGSKLVQSLEEGELPEGAQIGDLKILCMAVVTGLTVLASEGIDAATLRVAGRLWVRSVGFHSLPAKHSGRGQP